MTAPALFRTLHARGGTLLLDEAEQLKNTRDPAVAELLSMLLAGYKKGGSAMRLEPVGDSFRTVSFDVFGPKALACVAGLPPALASRAIPVIMFRASPSSPKPRRVIDADPGRWQRLRDGLHALALDTGPQWLDLARRDDCVPDMSGRDFELWQPLLAIAAWVDENGARGLLPLLQDHASAVIEASRAAQTVDADEVLLRLLAQAVLAGGQPTPGELLRQAQEAEPALFKSWTARAVTSHLTRYGVPTPSKISGRRVFRDVTVDQLREIQAAYGLDLALDHAETDP